MDELPFELIKKILKYLPLNNLLLCKKVNRKWYNIIDDLKLTKLAITDSWNFKGSYWFPDYQQINQQEIIKIENFDTFNYKLKSKYQFEGLKFLFIHSMKQSKSIIDKDTKFKLSDLTKQLPELQSLTIIGLILNNENDYINLKKLKSLYIHNFHCNKIVLETPNLINLKMKDDYGTFLVFNYPKKLKSLYVSKIYSCYIEDFSNLEYLYVEHIYNLRQTFLNELPLLKEFHFESTNNWEIYEDLLESKKQTNRTDLKIFMFGIDFNCLDKHRNVDHYYCLKNDNIKLIKDYSTRLANRLLFVYSICYNDFEELYDDKIPFDLINRFVNLEKLIINDNVNYEDQLLKIIELLSKRIKILEIDFSFLGQHFFNQLPKLIPIIDCLLIKNEIQKLNFNFLIQFESIRCVELDQFVSEEIVNKFLIKYKDDFKYFNHKQNINPIKISFDKKGILRTRKSNIKNLKKDNLGSNYCLNELFDYNSLDDLSIGNLFSD